MDDKMIITRGFQEDGSYVTLSGEIIYLEEEKLKELKVFDDIINNHGFKNAKDIKKSLDRSFVLKPVSSTTGNAR